MKPEDREKLEALFDAGAAKVASTEEHWIHNGDEGLSYCRECCEKEVAKLLKADPSGEYCVDGGWGIEGDTTPYCETCGKLLDNTLTEYGCEAEVDHFLRNGFDPASPGQCRSMSEVIMARGWEPMEGRTYRDDFEKKSDLDYFAALDKLCAGILKSIS